MFQSKSIQLKITCDRRSCSEIADKLSRGFDRDIKDVEAMYDQKLFTLSKLKDCFEAIAPELIRFPSLNPDVLRSKVENFIGRFEEQEWRDGNESQ